VKTCKVCGGVDSEGCVGCDPPAAKEDPRELAIHRVYDALTLARTECATLRADNERLARELERERCLRVAAEVEATRG
jgi:hypothetical protein